MPTHAQRVLDTLDGMHEELRALRGAERGTLTLAASTTPGSYVLPVHVGMLRGAPSARRRRRRHRVERVGRPSGLRGARCRSACRRGRSPDGVARASRSSMTSGRNRATRPAAAVDAGASPVDRALDTARARAGVEHPRDRRALLARSRVSPGKRWELDSNEAIKRTVRAGLGVGFVVAAGRRREELGRGELQRSRSMARARCCGRVFCCARTVAAPVPGERAFIETRVRAAASVAGCTPSARSPRTARLQFRLL